jgi:SAM-dependent methyltransferase
MAQSSHGRIRRDRRTDRPGASTSGCGPGTVTAYLAERGIEVSGIDLSPRMIDHARRLYPQCAFGVGSATDLDLRPCSLTESWGGGSLFNLPCSIVPAVLAAFARALRPGDQQIIDTHLGNDDVKRTEAYNGYRSGGRPTSGSQNSSSC